MNNMNLPIAHETTQKPVAAPVRLPAPGIRIVGAAAVLALAGLLAGCDGGASNSSPKDNLKAEVEARKKAEAVRKAKDEIKPLVVNSLMHGKSLDRIAKENGMTPEQGRQALNALLYPKTAAPRQSLSAFHQAWLQELATVDAARSDRIKKEFEDEMEAGKK